MSISNRPEILPFSFFFQAEDGIRDGTVTGVQTCALPIFRRFERPGVTQGGASPRSRQRSAHSPDRSRVGACPLRADRPRLPSLLADRRALRLRSEEHTSELQSQFHLVCRLLLEKKNKYIL